MMSDFSSWSGSHLPQPRTAGHTLLTARGHPTPWGSRHGHPSPGCCVSAMGPDPAHDVSPEALCTPEGGHTNHHLLGTQGIVPRIFLWEPGTQVLALAALCGSLPGQATALHTSTPSK